MLFKQFAAKMMATCLRYARDSHQAEDFLQMGFIRVFECIHQYKAEGSFEGWMRRVFSSIAIRELSKIKMQFVEIGQNEIEFTEPSGALQKMSEGEIIKLISTLPDGYRIVFNLYAIEGYSHDEIAEMLSIKASTSRSQLVKARKMLQEKIINQQKAVAV
ncbi:RNA polymerase sigma factor [Polluticaenibacter yanchengensis]|uniref:Sigma-70 family RNA polymerase sigma factor n=1 Tax=Polluticaenibacter yanchengensis TaxID=3014562 RepID=A0ABT4UHA2_9BACT|nr:sigma-70 family RNA polymerase sigma factor [Chitinophagaceae bacterium LY-5]